MANWTLAQATKALEAFQALQPLKPYQYRKLNEGEIRLVKISLPVDSNIMPVLEIQHSRLDCAPDFEAMSYCWGNNDRPYNAPITDADPLPSNPTCQTSLPLTKSLSEMLAYLPAHCLSRRKKISYIWVDQICINQSSDKSSPAEKTQQIRIMKDIYSKASRVLIWLGPGPDPDTARIIADILSDRDINRRLHLWKSSQPTRDSIAIDYVWQNPWFTRSWVIQETCLARHQQHLVGYHRVSSANIAQLVIGLKLGRRPPYTIEHQTAVAMWEIFESFCGNCDRSRGLFFCSFLARVGQHLQATDDKDKVLAFLSLWQPGSFDIAKTAEENASEVYSMLTRSLLKDTRSLDVLSAVRTAPPRDHERQQPSWVPRWDVEVMEDPSPLLRVWFREPASTIRWDASWPHCQHNSPAQEGMVLAVRGRIISSISEVLPKILNEAGLHYEFELVEFEKSLDCESKVIDLHSAMKTMLECTQLGRAVSSGESNELRIWLSELLDKDLPIKDFREQIEAKLEEYGNIGISYIGRGKSFFTTQDTSNTRIWIGLGPGYTEAGDKISILHGARVPMILRQIKGEPKKYQVVGECYVEGLMYGEAVDWEEKDADDIWLV